MSNKLCACEICNKNFKQQSLLDRHKRIHTGERPFKCDYCESAFNQKEALMIHQQRHTGIKPHQCQYCQAKFTQKGNLKNHIKRIHNENTQNNEIRAFKCAQCSCIFKTVGSLNGHISRRHEKQTRKISLDNLRAQLIYDLEQIYNCYLNNDENMANEILSKIITDLNISSDLLKTVIESNLNKIKLDSYVSIAKIIDIKEDYERKQEEEQQRQDEQQPQEQDQLKQQQQEDNSHKSDENLAAQESSSSPQAANEINILSSIMDSTTGQIKKYYIRKMNNSRYYVCYYCYKEFRKPSDLIRHTRTHTSEKPYKCNLCLSEFTVKSTLITHMKTHTHLKAFKCNLCLRQFSCKVTFKLHLKQKHLVNDLSNLFDYLSIDNNTNNSSDNELRLGAITKNKLAFKCDYCCKKFYKRKNYLKHVDLMHNKNGINEDNNQDEVAGVDTDDNEGSEKECFNKLKQKQYSTNNTATATAASTSTTTATTNSCIFYACNSCKRKFKSKQWYKNHLFKCKTTTTAKTFSELNDKTNLPDTCLTRIETSGSNSLSNSDEKLEKIAATNLENNVNDEPVEFLINTVNKTNNNNNSNHVLIENTDSTDVHNIFDLLFNGHDNDCETASLDHQMQKLINDEMMIEMNVNGCSDGNEDESGEEENCVYDVYEDDDNYDDNQEIIVNNKANRKQTSSSSSYCKYNNSQINGGCGSSSHMRTIDNYEYEHINNHIIVSDTIADNNADNVHHNDESSIMYKCHICEHNCQSYEYLRDHLNDHCSNICYITNNSTSSYEILFNSNSLDSIEILNTVMLIHNDANNENECFNLSEKLLYKCFIDKLNELNQAQQLHMQQQQQQQQQPQQQQHLQIEEDNIVSNENDEPLLNTFHIDDISVYLRNDSTFVLSSIDAQPPPTATTQVPTQEQVNPLAETTATVNEIQVISTNTSVENNNKNADTRTSNHQCEVCSKQFKKSNDLLRHMRTHTGERPYQCQLCTKSFTVKCALEAHIRTHLDLPKPYVCNHCMAKFSAKASLVLHERIHTGYKPFHCDICNTRYRTSSLYKSHMLSKHSILITRKRQLIQKSTINTLQASSSTEQISEQLNNELMMRDENIRDENLACNDKFEINLSANDEHNSLISNNNANTAANRTNDDYSNEFQIGQIDLMSLLQSFDISSVLDEPGGEPSIECNLYLNEQDHNHLIDDHEHQHQAQQQQLVQSDHQLLASSLHDHQMVQTITTGRKRRSTKSRKLNVLLKQIENEKSNRASLLSNDEGSEHHRLHNHHHQQQENTQIITNFRCDECKSIFNSQNDLYMHYKKNNCKRHQCTVCFKSFTKPSELKRHLFIHTGEKPFKCLMPGCNKAFNQKNTLDAHMRIHNGNKPYKCSYCNFAFTQNGNLQVHIKRIHTKQKDSSIIRADGHNNDA